MEAPEAGGRAGDPGRAGVTRANSLMTCWGQPGVYEDKVWTMTKFEANLCIGGLKANLRA